MSIGPNHATMQWEKFGHMFAAGRYYSYKPTGKPVKLLRLAPSKREGYGPYWQAETVFPDTVILIVSQQDLNPDPMCEMEVLAWAAS